MSKDDKYFLDMAFQIASEAERSGGQKMCSLLVIKRRIVAIGVNGGKTHPMAKKYARDNNPELIFPHAEIKAISRAARSLDIEDFNKATIYVARAKMTSSKGRLVWGMAKPCNGCRCGINAFGIKKVVYTTNEQGVMGVFIKNATYTL